jgi:hypothetical protein
MMGPPNASRRLAYSVTYSYAALAIPSACAATIGRVCSKVPSMAEPECRPPSMAQLFVDDRIDDVHVGDTAVADPHLVPVDDPVIAVAAWASCVLRCRRQAR